MNRIAKRLVPMLVCLAVFVCFAQSAAAVGIFSSGVVTSKTGLFLTSPEVQASHAGPDSENSHTVDSVTFVDRAADTSGIWTSGGFHNWSGGSAPNLGDAEFNASLNDVRVLHTGSQANQSFSFLTPGTTYQYQLIRYDGDFTRGIGAAQITAVNSGQLADVLVYPIVPNLTNTTANFINYLFVAGASGTLTINILAVDTTPLVLTDNPSTMILSAYNLRAIPEPTSGCLLVLGICGIAAARRTSKRRASA